MPTEIRVSFSELNHNMHWSAALFHLIMDSSIAKKGVLKIGLEVEGGGGRGRGGDGGRERKRREEDEEKEKEGKGRESYSTEQQMIN